MYNLNPNSYLYESELEEVNKFNYKLKKVLV